MPDYYGTEVGFEEYCDARAYTVPANADVVPALLRASLFIDANFGSQFTGVKTGGRDQLRAWPRSGAYDAEGWGYQDNEYPVHLLHATYEATLRELVSPGSLSPDVTPGKIKTAVSVGSVSVSYASGGIQGEKPVLTILGGVLAPLLGNKPASNLFGTSTRG